MRCGRWHPRNVTPLLVHLTRGQAKWLQLNRERFFAERLASWERTAGCGRPMRVEPSEPSDSSEPSGGSGGGVGGGGGVGVRSSAALFQLLVNTYDRDRSLRVLLRRYMGCDRVDRVGVVWNDFRRRPPPWLVAMQARASARRGGGESGLRGSRLVILVQHGGNLTNRFAAVRQPPLADSAPSDAIFSIDDDVLYTCEALSAAHDAFLWLRGRRWGGSTPPLQQASPQQASPAADEQSRVSPMVGFAPRHLHWYGRPARSGGLPSYVWNEPYQQVPIGSGSVGLGSSAGPGGRYNSVFVTKGGLTEWSLLAHDFFAPRWHRVRQLVDDLNTGEDMLLSAVHYCLHHRPLSQSQGKRGGGRAAAVQSAVQSALLAVAAPGQRVPTGRSACTPALVGPAGASGATAPATAAATAPATAAATAPATAAAEAHYVEVDNDVNPLSKRTAGARGPRAFGSYAAGSARVAVLRAIRAELTPSELRGWASLRLRSWWRWFGHNHSRTPAAVASGSPPLCWI